MLTPAERRRAREFDSRVATARAGRAAASARHSAGLRSAGLHRASVGRPPSVPGAGADDLSGLVLLAGRLGRAAAGAEVEADAEYRDRLRQRLIAVASVRALAAEPAFPPAPAQPDPRRGGLMVRHRIPRRVTVASGTLAGLVALSGVGFASGGAAPGDALYAVKRSRESAQLTLARSPVARGSLYLQFARSRLAEAAVVTADRNQFTRLLDDMDTDIRLGMVDLGTAAVDQHHPAPLKLVDEFALSQQNQLERLRRAARIEISTRIHDSLQLLLDVSDRSSQLRFSVYCSGPFRTDALGPRPTAKHCSPPVSSGAEVSSVQPEPSTADYTTSRPDEDDSSRTENRQDEVPSGSAAPTPGQSSSPATEHRSTAEVEDDSGNDPWGPAGQGLEPESGPAGTGPSGLPRTSATDPLVGSVDQTFGGLDDLVERSGDR